MDPTQTVTSSASDSIVLNATKERATDTNAQATPEQPLIPDDSEIGIAYFSKGPRNLPTKFCPPKGSSGNNNPPPETEKAEKTSKAPTNPHQAAPGSYTSKDKGKKAR